MYSKVVYVGAETCRGVHPIVQLDTATLNCSNSCSRRLQGSPKPIFRLVLRSIAARSSSRSHKHEWLILFRTQFQSCTSAKELVKGARKGVVQSLSVCLGVCFVHI